MLRARFVRKASTFVRRLSWTYLLFILAFWGYLRLMGDVNWLGTVILFGPLWISVLPAAVLIPSAMILSQRSLPVLLAALWIALFPIMGLCIPWRTFVHSNTGGQHLRLLTCNINGPSLNEASMAALIDEAQPDIIVLEEWQGLSRRPAFVDPNWFIRDDGELFVASRYPITTRKTINNLNWQPWGGSFAKYDVAATGGVVHLFAVHFTSPHNQFQAVIDGVPSASNQLEMHVAVRLEQSKQISEFVERDGGGAIVAGDFNSIAEGRIFRRSWKQFSDAYETAGFGLGHTYFSSGAAVRIDHILAGRDWQFTTCHVGPNVGSPHRPLIADLERVKP